MSEFRMPTEAALAGVRLRVRDLERCVSFYEEVLGLEVGDRAETGARLGPAGGGFTLELVADPRAPQRPYPCPGLYHFALLVPGREALGAVLRRLAHRGDPLEGMADHAVSEALYLRDPEMNGIEIYRDRPREDWPYRGDEVAMVSEPLDVDGLLAAADGDGLLPAGTRLGHIHLHTTDLEAAERFYAQALGIPITQRSYPGVLFLGWGGYHHHVATNVWAPNTPVPEGATGLLDYTCACPSDAVEALERHLEGEGIRFERTSTGLAISEPAGAEIVVAANDGGQ